jgi:RNA polymerase sigma-70 factor, ECF subfamily
VIRGVSGTQLHDDVLAARAAQGDAEALVVLLERHFGYVTAVCRRVLNNAADAEEARQEALMSAARRIVSFQGRSQFRTWIHRIAVSAALDCLERQKRRPESPHAEIPDQPAPGPDPTIRLDIDAALRALAPSFREAVVLRDLCDLDYDEIAERLQIPVGTVRSRIARGRDQLAALLGHYPVDAR